MPELDLRRFFRRDRPDLKHGISRLLPGVSEGGTVRLLSMEPGETDCEPPSHELMTSDQPVPDIGEAFSSPTFTYTDTDGFNYFELTEPWKEMCSVLPCFDALHWPGYSTIHIEVTVKERPLVIQLWKGWCQRFLGLKKFPGGIGAEVGIYHRVPGRKAPDSLPFLDEGAANFVFKTIVKLNDSEIWWPVTDQDFLGDLEFAFELINPLTGETFFRAGPVKDTYWLAKWMDEVSYTEYRFSTRAPMIAAKYILHLKINGEDCCRW